MVSASAIPENIRQDIAIYLAPDEEIEKAISSVSGKTAAIGEVWLILTAESIFFHTCEQGKEPVIALISRKEIREIDYFQRQNEIVLTFVPEKKPTNTTKLTFPIAKKAELEDFCENLADLINFRMETKSGVKVFPKPDEPAKAANSAAISSSQPKPKAEASAKEEKPETTGTIKSEKQSRPPTPEVKIVGSRERMDKDSDKIPSPRYIMLATIISLLVAFIWYQFFSALASRQDK